MAARSRQTGRNFVFFDAPVGLIFTIDATLTKHSWLDYGLFLQTLMLAAQVRGLATCPQVSFVRFQSIIAEQLGLGAEEVVQRIVDGMRTPAIVRNSRVDYLSANALGRALYAPVFESREQPANSARFTFLDPAAQFIVALDVNFPPGKTAAPL
jgi:nitroreductase